MTGARKSTACNQHRHADTCPGDHPLTGGPVHAEIGGTDLLADDYTFETGPDGRTRVTQSGFWESYPLEDLDNVISGDLNAYLGEDISIEDLCASQHFDTDRIEALTEQVRAKGRITEALVFHVHPDGRVVLRDGHHRYVVARDLGLEHAPVDFHLGEYDEDGELAFPTDESW